MITEAIIYGIIGGGIGELLALQKWLRTPKKKRRTLDSSIIELMFALIIDLALAYLIVFAYEKSLGELNLFLAIHLGASAPLITRILMK
jgi:hypothetical protein